MEPADEFTLPMLERPSQAISPPSEGVVQVQ